MPFRLTLVLKFASYKQPFICQLKRKKHYQLFQGCFYGFYYKENFNHLSKRPSLANNFKCEADLGEVAVTKVHD